MLRVQDNFDLGDGGRQSRQAARVVFAGEGLAVDDAKTSIATPIRLRRKVVSAGRFRPVFPVDENPSSRSRNWAYEYAGHGSQDLR